MENTVWLSGSGGYVGSYLYKYLQELNYPVKSISNTSTGENIVYIDFSNPNDIANALELHGVPKTFIHLGWGNVYDIHHECHITENVQNSINLINVLFEKGVERFISVGSVSEYGDRVGLLSEEHSPLGDLNNYVKGKLAVSEYGLQLAKKLGRIFIHTRLFYTYGAGQTHNSLINQLYATYISGERMNLSPCKQYRDYIHISESIEGIKNLINVNQSSVVNLAGGKVIQLKEFVRLFWSELGGDESDLIFGAHDKPLYEQNQPKSYADLSNLKKLTGWIPALSIKDGIQKTIDVLHKINLQK